MCGRYSLKTPAEALARHFQVSKIPPLSPRFNIAPSQPVAVVRTRQSRECVLLRWGLIPEWAKDPAIGNRMINARAETATEKPAFRGPLARSRCLIPADGYYEWSRETRLGPRKQPFYIRMRDGSPFAFAGLWERWTGPDGGVMESCALLTTEPNELIRPIHDRMPVILRPEDYEEWLDPAVRKAELLLQYFQPFASGEMTASAVGMRVNDPACDDADCLSPPDAKLF